MIALHKVDSALETWRTITAEMLCCDSPPKCRAFIVICVNYAITTQHQPEGAEGMQGCPE